MKTRNEDPQIGADDDGEWELTPALDRAVLTLLFALAFLSAMIGVATLRGWL